jgi:hypothetical protein
MIKFLAPTTMQVVGELYRAGTQLTIDSSQWDGNGEPPSAFGHLADAVKDCEKAIAELPLSTVLTEQWQDINRSLQSPEDFGTNRPDIRAQVFFNGLVTELRQHMFFLIPQRDTKLYRDSVNWFEDGKSVLRTFRKIQPDVEAAGRCCALNEWSATVFHSMCILDHGLRYMARRTGLTLPKKEEWHQLITLIEDKVTALRALKPPPKKKIAYFSGAAVEFRHFKDAWRNYTMHAVKSYEENEARRVLTSVKYFMRALV